MIDRIEENILLSQEGQRTPVLWNPRQQDSSSRHARIGISVIWDLVGRLENCMVHYENVMKKRAFESGCG